MKRTILYVLMMILWSPVTSAMGEDSLFYDFEYEGLRYIKYDSTVTLTNGSIWHPGYLVLPSPNIIIPSTVPYEGKVYTVTAISGSTFEETTLLETITLPETLRTIGSRAFFQSGLTGELILPDSIESIGSSAFACQGLQGTLTLPESLKTLGEGAFQAYNGITCVNYNCINCTYKSSSPYLALPSDGALPYLTTDLVFGDKVTFIPENLARGCRMITNLTIPESLDSIARGAFDSDLCTLKKLIFNAVNLRRIYSFPSRRNMEQLTIGENVEYLPPVNGSRITSVVVPNKVKIIAPGAFGCSTMLCDVKLGNSVDTIGEAAFNDCISLTSINIPASVRFLGSDVFRGCKALNSITVELGNTIYDSRDGCNAINETATNTLFCGCNNSFIPNTICTISQYAFAGYEGLKQISFPTSVSSIGERAFWGCTGLSQITIPATLTHIGDNAFSDCTGLTEITISDKLTSLGIGAFSGCTGLEKVTFPDDITEIPNYLFSSCTDLPEITIPATMNKIGNMAFNQCTGLAKIISLARRPPAITACNDTNSSGTFAGINHQDISIYVPDKSWEMYCVAEGWSQFVNIFKLSQAPGRCDLNADGMTDIADVSGIINAMLGYPNNGLCDIDGDGKVDIYDINLVINAMLGK